VVWSASTVAVWEKVPGVAGTGWHSTMCSSPGARSGIGPVQPGALTSTTVTPVKVVVPVLATPTVTVSGRPTDPEGSSKPARTVTKGPDATWWMDSRLRPEPAVLGCWWEVTSR